MQLRQSAGTLVDKPATAQQTHPASDHLLQRSSRVNLTLTSCPITAHTPLRLLGPIPPQFQLRSAPYSVETTSLVGCNLLPLAQALKPLERQPHTCSRQEMEHTPS